MLEELIRQVAVPEQQGSDDGPRDEDTDPNAGEDGAGNQGEATATEQTSNSVASGNSEDPESEQQAIDLEATQEEEDTEANRVQLAKGQSEAERAQATEQWLRQIPDNPGGLLRRKFQYQYERLYGDTPYPGNRW